ncbi:MAG: V-type ATP synthase subunit I, partial [Gammaproteobacteria bacterium]
FLVLRREQLVNMAEWLQAAWGQCAPLDGELHHIEDRLLELEHLEAALDELADLNIDLGKLQGELDYLDLNIGSLPVENLNRLRDALALEGHLVVNVAGKGETVRVAIAGIRHEQSGLDNILTSAGFQPIEIPSSFQDQPEKVRAALADERQTLLARRDELCHQIENWGRSNAKELARAQRLILAAGPYVGLGEAARSEKNLAALQGWLPAEKLPEVERVLKENLTLPYVLEDRRPKPDEYHLVPIPPRQSRWLKPFAELMRNYGVPRFSEIDPTVVFALSFAAMFGMMFGDVGHGLVFVLVGVIWRRKLGHFSRLFMVAGGMAVLFGFLYGSVFGVEHWIHPLWIAPMSDPKYMLTVALVWGIAFISLGSVIAIANRLSSNDLLGALFDSGGVLSLIVYYALLGGAVNVTLGQGWPLAASVVLAVTLLLLVAYQWIQSDAPAAERALVVLIETFELISGYVSNSLSFLRIAAFSLNHVALSLAVFALADMMTGPAHWLMLIMGNLFVIVLEGMIVTIQTLRLEYYEGFSRYFYGDGVPFKPLRLERHTPISSRSEPAHRKGVSS